LLSRLQAEAKRLLNDPSVEQQIQQRQARLGEKWYVVRPLGYDTQQTLPESFAELCLNPRILAVVNQYFGMFSRLRYAGLWYNLPVFDHERGIDSERWHRDYEDRNVLKVYAYLDDVDEHMGPLQYLRGTQPGGVYGHVVPAVPAFGATAPPEQLAAFVPNQANISCVGPAGTLVFCDTAGIHRGGRSTTKPRIVVTATFITDGGVDHWTFELENRAQLKQLDTEGRFALHQT
jgi:Phytanoyl-CoA dioxygenase (PhyH)